jgi:hypothetical protein
LAVSLLLGSPVRAAQNSVQTSTTSPLPGLTLIAGLNAAALNYITLDSGPGAPTASSLGLSSTANVIWQDTATGAVKVRNSADTGWVRLLDIDQTNGVASAVSTVLSGAAPLTVNATEHYGLFVSTAAQSFTLAQTSTLWNGFTFSIFAMAGPATVGINAADAINGGTVGAGTTIPAGSAAQFRTDGAGNWFMTVEQAARGTGTIASASTTDLCSVANPYLAITGTTTITSFGSSCQAGQSKTIRFAGALTLTDNATSLILPNNGANIVTASGDTAIVMALGGGNYVVVSYQYGAGTSPPASARPLSIVGLLPSSIAGLSNSASLSISSGYATDATNAVQIASLSTLNWNAANGSAINGIAGGGTLSASSSVHFLLCDGSSGVGAMATGIWPVSTSQCPSNYNTYARYIFSIQTLATGAPISGNAAETDGGGYDFYYANAVTDLSNGGSIGTAGALVSVTVPSGPNVLWIGRVQNSNSSALCIDSPLEPVSCGVVGTAPGFDFSSSSASVQIGTMRALTDTGAHIRAVAGLSNTNIYVWTRGYHEPRRN